MPSGGGTRELFSRQHAFFLLELCFLSSFISQNQRTTAGNEGKWMMEQNQNNKIGGKQRGMLILHREASPVTKEKFFEMVAPAEALLHLRKK